MKHYLVREEASSSTYMPAKVVEPEEIRKIGNSTRIKILKLLRKKPMYPAELAKKIKMHEQKVYYHINQLHDAGVIDVVETQEKRGTVAKKFAPKYMNFCITLEAGESENKLGTMITDVKISNFLKEFVDSEKNFLDAEIIVGSPDPHGPFKARARDSHYAIELGLFLGRYAKLPQEFSAKLDVDCSLKNDKNMILVGGPITNLLVSEINKHLPIKFSSEKPWGLVSGKNVYTDDTAGLVAKIKNPFNDKMLLVLAGVRHIGTKAAVMAVTRNWDKVLKGDKEFAVVVEGYDIDGDGKIDEIEVLQ